MLTPVRTVRATTREEIDAALATADQVTVEGDDELLTYAVNKASSDPDNQVAIELEDRRPAVPARAFGRLSPRVIIIGTAIVIVALVGLLAILLTTKPSAEAPPLATPPAPATPSICLAAEPWTTCPLLQPLPRGAACICNTPDGHPLSGVVVEAHPEAPPEPTWQPTWQPTSWSSSDLWPNLPSLLWPLVAIVAIVALFLIAWKAISSGSNVTIQWKVTEKVSGRVVITKVRERAPRQSKAA